MGKVLLVMGHNNTTHDGTIGEEERTPRIVAAAARELRNAGHEVHILQEEDGDGDPKFTHASLAFVGQQCAQLIKQHGIDVMIDCHFQGSPNPVSGCFCIFPDGNGLNPPPPVDDGKAANQQAVAFAARLSEELSRATGIRRLPLSEPGFLGGMSERQTGVGLGGSRLGMFRLTVPPPRMVRVVMEHGDTQADGAIINSAGFYDRVGSAYVRAVDAFWPAALPVSPQFFAFPEPRQFTAQAGAIGRKQASTSAEVIRRYDGGESIRCLGYYEAQSVASDNRWLRSTDEDSPRIHRSGVLEEIPLGTPTLDPNAIGAAEAAEPMEEALAEAAALARGDLAMDQIVDTAGIGCAMILGLENAATANGATDAAAAAAAEMETEADTGADAPVGYPVEITVAAQGRTDFVGITEHGETEHDDIGALALISSAVWGGRDVRINTTNGQPAVWDPCKNGGTCNGGCADGCCWYDYATDVCLPHCTHPGMDLGVSKHTALYAAAAGAIEFAGRDGFYKPFHVDVRTATGELHIYGHMWSVDPDIVTGGPVRAGQFLGTSGEQTQGATMNPDGSGPHLHFERRLGTGCAVDPTPVLEAATVMLQCSPSPPPPFDGNPVTIGSTVFHPDRRTVTAAFNGLGCRRWGNLEACTTRSPLTAGEKVDVLYWVTGQKVAGEDRWWVATDGTRFHVGGTVEKPSAA